MFFILYNVNGEPGFSTKLPRYLCYPSLGRYDEGWQHKFDCIVTSVIQPKHGPLHVIEQPTHYLNIIWVLFAFNSKMYIWTQPLIHTVSGPLNCM